MTKTLIARVDTFTKAGKYVPRGGTLSSDEIDYDPKTSTNVVEAPGDETVVVEMSAIAPTGPNPTRPQQIPPDAEQIGEGYQMAGATLVGETTLPEKQRRVAIVDEDNTAQGDAAEALAEADADNNGGTATGNDDDDLVAGTVDDVTAGLADLDEAGLRRLRAAEEDREKPRKGVISAIDKELEGR